MLLAKLKGIAPYVILLAVAAYLYVLTGQMTYAGRPGQIGPDFWPKVAIALIAAVSVLEIVRRLIAADPDTVEVRGVAERLDREDGEDLAEAPARPLLLAAGVALILAYGLLINVIGFLTASFLFLVLFMYVGGIRNHLLVWTVSALGILVFATVFLKIVYVSMPRGIPPFDSATQLIMDLLRIR